MAIDNTNVTRESRKKYIELAQDNKYEVIAYYFESSIQDCLERNKNRQDKINEIGVKSKYKEFEKPLAAEGFDSMLKVEIIDKEFYITDYEV